MVQRCCHYVLLAHGRLDVSIVEKVEAGLEQLACAGAASVHAILIRASNRFLKDITAVTALPLLDEVLAEEHLRLEQTAVVLIYVENRRRIVLACKHTIAILSVEIVAGLGHLIELHTPALLQLFLAHSLDFVHLLLNVSREFGCLICTDRNT